MDWAALLFAAVILVIGLFLIIQMRYSLREGAADNERWHELQRRAVVEERRIVQKRRRVWSEIDAAYARFREQEKGEDDTERIERQRQKIWSEIEAAYARFQEQERAAP